MPVKGYKPLEYLLDNMPDIVVLDVRLKNGYGHVLCKELKENP